MIKINKSVLIPGNLTVNGGAECKAICAQYTLNPAVYKIKYHKTTNPFKLKFKGTIYGEDIVKSQIIADQYEKCCFCEGMFLDHSFGDVEHYRPKGGYQQANSDTIKKPGYYWLAYEWSNLMFSCEICNRKYKKNLFPLTAGTVRALQHTDALESLNNCLLIDPNHEDPQPHIKFNKHIPVGQTAKGRKSITSYGLKRTKLNEARERHLNIVKSNLFLSAIDLALLQRAQIDAIKATVLVATDAELQQIIDVAIAFVANCAKSNQPFTNMVRCAYPHLPQV